jgi:predicted CXXCH cytochrome family protein
MKILSTIKQLARRRRWARGLALASGVGLLAVISCSTTRQAVILPEVPGAKYIGSSECEQCHDEIYRSFKTADHSRLLAKGKNGKDYGCESCHGPCSIHSDSGGETLPPYSFKSGRPQPTASGARLPETPARAIETVCYQCHLDVRGQFNLPSHHPVPEGNLSCVECHPPHSGVAFAAGGTQLLSQNENCLRCHEAQQGPFVFDHEALREGCTTCHSPHGSVNDKLLTERNSNLCLKCHFQEVKSGAILIGGVDHTTKLSEGSCWSAGCHEAVHGSRVSPTLRF